MILKSIVINNFMSIEDTKIDLDARGLVSIEGVTYDDDGSASNGSGKSTLINAIMWCNFDDPGKKLKSVDHVVNKKAGKNCRVVCYWYDELEDITYEVYRHRKHATHKNELIILARKDLSVTNITKGTNAETQKLLESILGCDKATFEAYCFARQENAVDIPGMGDTELKKLLEKVLPLEKLEPMYKTAVTNHAAQFDVVLDLETNLHDIETTGDRLLEDITKTRYRSAMYADTEKARKDEITFRINEKTKLIKSYLSTFKDPKKIEDAIAALEDEINSFDNTAYKEFFKLKGEAEGNAAKLKKLVNDLPTECPTCHRDFERDEEEMQRIKRDLDKAKDEVAKLYSEEVEWNEKYRKQVEENRLKIRKLHDLSKTQRATETAVDRLKHDIERLRGDFAEVRPNPHVDVLKELTDELATVDAKRIDLANNLAEAKQVLRVKEAAMETLSPKGVRFHLLEKIAPALSDRTNHYLYQLTDGAMTAKWSTVTKLKSGEYKEKFSVEVSGKNFDSYGSLSGGEKRKVRLACFFALQDIIARNATKPINIWCGDEIDHALDEAGLERLIGLLHEKTETKSTILVISHNELREWIPNFTTVVKKNGVSTITGYLA